MFKCTRCGETFPEDEMMYKCKSCDSLLRIEREIEKPKFKGKGIRKYKEVLPVDSEITTLQEGDTPLYNADYLANKYGFDSILLKHEGLNPTGAFKDRGSAVTVTKAQEYGYNSLVLASTGNMAASVSAYSSKSRMNCKVYVPADTPPGKLFQVQLYGGEVMKIRGSFQDCMDRVWDEVGKGKYLAETGLNPYYLEGEKTVAYEFVQQMDGVPDVIIAPMGTGGFLSSIYWALEEQKELGMIDEIPRLIGTQARACSPIVDAFNEGHGRPKPPQGAMDTIASSIHVKTAFNGHTAVEAMNETGGFGVEVRDDKIIQAMFEMGKEGVFGEPASALPLAALKKIMDPEEEDLSLDKDQEIMLMVTGNGLKESELMAERNFV